MSKVLHLEEERRKRSREAQEEELPFENPFELPDGPRDEAAE